MIESAIWRALGTTAHLLVADGDLALARRGVDEVLDSVEQTYSRFRPDSELSRLNASPDQDVRVSGLLGQAIAAALRGARLSDGALDPTVGTAMRLVGYSEDFGRVLERDDPLTLRVAPVPGWRAVRFDPQTRRVRLPRGVELDLDSTGKALAADLAAAAASDALGGRGALLSLGGDIALAGPVPVDGWRVLVAEDSAAAPDGPGEVIVLHGGALATSSTTVRRWARGGVTLHHLLDPRTGLPAVSPWRTASVLAASCVDANIAATAAIVRGADAPAWLEATGLAARLVSTSGAMRRVGAWPVAAAPNLQGRAAPAPTRTFPVAHHIPAAPVPSRHLATEAPAMR